MSCHFIVPKFANSYFVKKALKIPKIETQDHLHLTGFMLLQFLRVKIRKLRFFFVIFKSCQIGLYSENRIKITVAKNLGGAYVGEKTISCSAGIYQPIILIECT